jgi:hypothetical protein
MKYLILLSFLCVFCSCDNKQHATVCAEKSDLYYEGYKGKIKKITISETVDSTVVWDIVRGYVYNVNEMFYDENGFETKRVYRMYMDGKMYAEGIYTISGKNPKTISYVDQDGNRSVDTILWQGNTHRNVGYDVVNGKTQMTYETKREYDNDCMLTRWVSESYDWSSGEKKLKEKTGHDFSKDSDEDKAARKKYGYAKIFHTYYQVIEWDGHDNPVKFLTKDPVLRSVVQYEYYD